MVRTCLLILLASLSVACTPRQKAPAERKGRIVSVTDAVFDTGGTDTVRFGRMRSGETAVQRLWLANDATRPVVILTYERSCGCTALEYDNQPIKPGDARQLTITFDSRGEQGWQLKTLDVVIAGGRKPLRIWIEADVQ